MVNRIRNDPFGDDVIYHPRAFHGSTFSRDPAEESTSIRGTSRTRNCGSASTRIRRWNRTWRPPIWRKCTRTGLMMSDDVWWCLMMSDDVWWCLMNLWRDFFKTAFWGEIVFRQLDRPHFPCCRFWSWDRRPCSASYWMMERDASCLDSWRCRFRQVKWICPNTAGPSQGKRSFRMVGYNGLLPILNTKNMWMKHGLENPPKKRSF